MPLSTAGVVPAFLGLTAFMQHYLACSPYNTILLVHDASTADLASTVLATASQAPRSNWVTLNMDEFPTCPCAVLDHRSQPVLNDTQALYVWLLADAGQMAATLQTYRSRLATNEHCNNVLITPGRAHHADLQRLLGYVLREQIVNAALVQQALSVQVSVVKLNYERFAALPFDGHLHCAAELFVDKTSEWQDRDLLLFMFMEPPCVLNLTRAASCCAVSVSGDHDRTAKLDLFVGGPYAYIGSFIDEHFGTRSRNFAVKKSEQYRYDRPDLSRFMADFMERTYREDIRQPHGLRYDLLAATEWDNYTFDKTVISFEEQIFDKPGTYSLYPHSLEKYILCVPKESNERSTLWSALLCFPLVYVWSFVITSITGLRALLRRVQGLRGKSVADMLFHTCGMSFGAVSTVRVENRPERVLLLFLSVFTMISGILCAGLLFQKFTTKVSEPGITSLEQLGRRSHLDVCMPQEFAPETEQWLRKQIPNRIVRLDKNIIQSMIFAKNTSAAYIVAETMLDILLSRVEMMDESGSNSFHELKYTIVSQQIRFVVPAWYMVKRFSALLHQTIEHGFMKYFDMRTAGVLNNWKPTKKEQQRHQSVVNSDALVMMPMEELRFVFVIYLLGVMAGAVAFVGELVRWRFAQRKWRRARYNS